MGRALPALLTVLVTSGCQPAPSHKTPPTAQTAESDARAPEVTIVSAEDASTASADVTSEPAPRLACDDAPRDPHALVRGKVGFARKRTRYPIAGTKLEVCVEDWSVPKTEDGHMLLYSLGVYEGGARVEPTADDAGEPTYRGLHVGASLLIPGVTKVMDGLFLHIR